MIGLPVVIKMTPQQRYNKKHPELIRKISLKFIKTVKGRHAALRQVLRKEHVPKKDLLWDLNFYSELIKDGVCHYCSGELNPTSHALDCMDNAVGHRCFNVVPCCRGCNWIKMRDMTYEEMMQLALVLRRIKQQRKR